MKRWATLSPCDEAAIQAVPADSPCLPALRPWILATTILASGMAFIDGTVVNVALPALQKEFDAGIAQAQWVIESYALILTALLLLGGSMGDRFGRRTVFTAGVALFGTASVFCGLAGTIEHLIWARAMQGLGGALLVPGSLALISASFPESIRGKAIGTWSGYSAVTAALGPVIGGFLIEQFSWRLAFFINIPLAAAVLFLAFRYVPESKGEQGNERLDWLGALLISTALGTLVYGLIESSTRGWSDIRVVGALASAPLAFAAFIRVEIGHPAPMLPLRLFRVRNFGGANVLTLLLYAALGGSLFFLPLNLVQVQGYSATAAGAALVPFIAIMFALSPWAGGLVDRYGARGPLMIGPAIAAMGFGSLAVPGIGGSYWTTFFPGIAVLGLGMTITVAPLTTTVMSTVDLTHAGAASGINNAVSRVASLLAIALLGIVMSQAFNHGLALGTRDLPVSPRVMEQIELQRDRLAAITLPFSASENEVRAIKTLVGGSFVYGFRRVMLISAFLAALSSLSTWLMIDPIKQDRQ